MKENTGKTIRVVIDRREGSFLVALDENDKEYVIASTSLPSKCRREGAVLDVPLDTMGQPIWKAAVRNEKAEAKLLREANERLARLRHTDPGGDVKL